MRRGEPAKLPEVPELPEGRSLPDPDLARAQSLCAKSVLHYGPSLRIRVAGVAIVAS